MSNVSLDAQPWFGAFDLAVGDVGTWELGALRLCVRRGDGEWRLSHREAGDPFAPQAGVRFENLELPAEEAGEQRYIVGDRSSRLWVQPQLPDRSLVTGPVSPVFVPAGESVRLYVGVPLWVRLEAGESRKRLTEIPTLRPSDTWFGPNTCEGELCYAIRSRCRLQLIEEQMLPHRAILPIVVSNRHRDLLVLERINIPVRQLGLYVDAGRRFWTEQLDLDRNEDGDFAALRVASGAPPEARGAEQISPARDPQPRKTAIRAFSALFQG